MGLALIKALFFGMGIGIGLEITSLVLIVIKYIIILLFLTAAMYWIQQEKPNKFFNLMRKGFLVYSLAIIVFIPLGIVSMYRWGIDLNDYFITTAQMLPKLFIYIILNLVTLLPQLLIASLICFLLLRRKNTKTEMNASEHLIDY